MNKLKKMYYVGSVSGDKDKMYEQNSGSMRVGNIYLVEKYTTRELRDCEGYLEHEEEDYLKSFNIRTKNPIEDRINPYSFISNIKKNCTHKNQYYLSLNSNIQRCHGCFKKFKTIISLKEIK